MVTMPGWVPLDTPVCVCCYSSFGITILRTINLIRWLGLWLAASVCTCLAWGIAPRIPAPKRPAAKGVRPAVVKHRTVTRHRAKPAVAPRNAYQKKNPLDGVTLGLNLIPSYVPSDVPPPPVPGTCARCAAPLLSTAYSLIGTPYRRGGSSPSYGFDCSGFTRYVYQSSLELQLPSSAPAQFLVGVPIAKSELIPGDLVFFRHRVRGWHVGMYVGDDSFIHAPNHRRTVSVSPLTDPYWSATYVGARRIPLAGLSSTPLSTNE